MDILRRYLKTAGWKQEGEHWLARNAQRFELVGEDTSKSWDRFLVAKLAEWILRGNAHPSPRTRPLIFVIAPRATPLIDKRLSEFVEDVAPQTAWLFADRHGNVFPHVADAPELEPTFSVLAVASGLSRTVNLFSDLNQWVLKVMLAPSLPKHLLRRVTETWSPNATTLAAAADVSLPVVSRLIGELDAEGHLDRSHGNLQLRAPLEFLSHWAAKAGIGSREEVGARFLRGNLNDGSFKALMTTANVVHGPADDWWSAIGLFDAASALGYGHVKGTPKFLYVASFDHRRLNDLGIAVGGNPGRPSDLILSVPRYPESIRRGLVTADGMASTDIIQCWLDATNYALRGKEQASFIARQLLDVALGPS